MSLPEYAPTYVHGKMLVSTFKKLMFDDCGVYVRAYDTCRNAIASDSKIIHEVRPKGASQGTSLSLHSNMRISRVEASIFEQVWRSP